MHEKLLLLTNLGNLDWVGVADGNTAHVDSSLNLEETLVSPVSAPRILDEPVIDTIKGAIADGENCMVDIRWTVLALGGAIDATFVVSEISNDLEGNRDWAVGEKGVLGGYLITLSDVEGSLWDREGVGVGFDGTFLVSARVGVSRFGTDTTSILYVLESVRWKTTLASVVVECLGTVNELLFSVEIGATVIFDHGVCFKSSNS